jgi:DNA-binding transcriptional regulator YiaG
LIKNHQVTLQVRFRGGSTQTLTIPAALRIWEMGKTPLEVVQMIDALLNEYSEQQVANILNERDLHPGKSDAFHRRLVARVRREHGLKSRFERLREAGMLTADEMAEALGVCMSTVMTWRRAGLLRGHVYNAKNSCLFEPPGPDAPTKLQGQKLADRRRFPDSEFIPDGTKEVQYEA